MAPSLLQNNSPPTPPSNSLPSPTSPNPNHLASHHSQLPWGPLRSSRRRLVALTFPFPQNTFTHSENSLIQTLTTHYAQLTQIFSLQNPIPNRQTTVHSPTKMATTLGIYLFKCQSQNPSRSHHHCRKLPRITRHTTHPTRQKSLPLSPALP